MSAVPIAARSALAPVAEPQADTVVTPARAQLGRARRLIADGFIYGVILIGALVLAAAALDAARHPDRFPLLLIVGAGAVGAASLPGYGNRFSLSPVPIVAVAYLAGPMGAALAGFATAVGFEPQAHKHARRSGFTAAVFLLSAFCGGVAGSPVTSLPLPFAWGLFAYGLVTGLCIYITNSALMASALSLTTGQSPIAIWRERGRWLLPQTVMLGLTGTGLAAGYRAVGTFEVLAFALPVAGIYTAWRQYLAHTTRSVEDLRQKNADLIHLAAKLQVAHDQLNTAYRGTLEALVGALDARDNEVQGHSYRVSAYSQILAERLGIERGSLEWETIARGALLHDVGKIGIRDAVLQKPGALDDAEWAEMRTHAQIGFGILRDIEFLQPAAALVAAHHERYDGGGYPRGLKGEEIPLGARIFSIADTFDAITTDRPYRRAMPPEVAVAEISRCAGTQFDPAVVDVFLQVWPELWAIRADAMHMVA